MLSVVTVALAQKGVHSELVTRGSAFGAETFIQHNHKYILVDSFTSDFRISTLDTDFENTNWKPAKGCCVFTLCLNILTHFATHQVMAFAQQQKQIAHKLSQCRCG